MNKEIFEQELKQSISKIDERLDYLLEIKYPEQIYEAMRYSVFAGGKRLRPVLLLASCRMFGGKDEDAVDFACAMEMIHTYSLIHDDLPAMDNDDFRRGKPTCHKQFGEALAILAGDALLNKAYEVLATAVVSGKDEKFSKAFKFIADYSGSCGMVGGQVVDVLSEGKQINSETLLYIDENKTAALIKAALKAGAVIGNATEEELTLIEKVGQNVGIAFQIKDDILDVTSTTEVLGKPVFSDEKNEKVTHITMYGIDEAQKELERLTDEALEIIAGFGEKGEFLFEYIKKLVVRIK